MKRRNEFLVGMSVLIAFAVVIGGAIWLSETDLRNRDVIHGVRFREVGFSGAQFFSVPGFDSMAGPVEWISSGYFPGARVATPR